MLLAYTFKSMYSNIYSITELIYWKKGITGVVMSFDPE